EVLSMPDYSRCFATGDHHQACAKYGERDRSFHWHEDATRLVAAVSPWSSMAPSTATITWCNHYYPSSVPFSSRPTTSARRNLPMAALIAVVSSALPAGRARRTASAFPFAPTSIAYNPT